MPANANEFAEAGYNRYHCYPYAQILDLESKLFFDRVHGMESAAVIYGSMGPAALTIVSIPPWSF